MSMIKKIRVAYASPAKEGREYIPAVYNNYEVLHLLVLRDSLLLIKTEEIGGRKPSIRQNHII